MHTTYFAHCSKLNPLSEVADSIVLQTSTTTYLAADARWQTRIFLFPRMSAFVSGQKAGRYFNFGIEAQSAKAAFVPQTAAKSRIETL